MRIILLSGGSGKRLWPLSNDTQSKQFLELLSDGKGKTESMVQRVYRQLRKALPDAQILISSNAAQTDVIRNQLGDVDIIPEPERRDTFPAVALAAAYLRFSHNAPDSETFLVLPIDVYADASFFEFLPHVAGLVSDGGFKIGLLGIKPTYPSEKYGYISLADGKVTGFKEKPDADTASELIRHDALWNAGVFALNVGYVLDIAAKYAEFSSYETFVAAFGELPKISFDYAVTEKESDVGAISYCGTWKDLGTWNTLTEEMSASAFGENICVSEDSGGTHVLNMLSTPVIALGVKDAVVVASHDGILVAGKEASGRLKAYAEQIKMRPMYERRRWGTYRVLEYIQGTSTSHLVKRIQLKIGRSISYQFHERRSEVWVILSGRGLLTLDDAESEVCQGAVIQIPSQVKHKLLAVTDVEFIEIQFGNGELEESDIVRLSE
jgi:mannose-1-phosphate guanylyltransferase